MNHSIKIDNVYKEYRLGVIGHGTLYQDLQSWAARLRGKEDPNSILKGHAADLEKDVDRVLALKGINLDIEQGTSLGIIGHNGAGKSTLLKVLSRITAPTKGTIKYKGRLSCLLEVGTGLHPELTGRENIFLNGAINGMNKEEVQRKFDEIVNFSGVEQYIDTPVKRYSSGMFVRLAFAVASHLEPDILVVDEVLAVGDMAFKEKAVDKMKSVSTQSGTTVLFVSHNMESIKNMCSRSIILKSGEIIDDGDTDKVVGNYLNLSKEEARSFRGGLYNISEEASNSEVEIYSIESINCNNKVSSELNISEPMKIQVEYSVKKEQQLAFSLEFIKENGITLFVAHDDYIDGEWGKQPPKAKGMYKTIFDIPANLFDSGAVSISINFFNPPEPANSYILKKDNIFSFVMRDFMDGSGARKNYPFPWGSPALRPLIECKTNYFKPPKDR